jgi:desampylase
MKVRISRMLLEQIMTAAAADGHEICGLLLGGKGRIDAILPAANVAPDPRRHFEIDPATLIAAHRAARAGGPAVFGHYHSHPGSQARPSATDTAQAAPDGALWLIVAGDRATLWRADPGGKEGVTFASMQLVVMDTPEDQAGVASPDRAAH